MTNPKSNDFKAKATAAAEQLKGKAEEIANNPKVKEGTAKAVDAAEKASTAASHQVSPLAGKLKSLTKGRWDKHIDTVSGKLEETLDRTPKGGSGPATGPTPGPPAGP